MKCSALTGAFNRRGLMRSVDKAGLFCGVPLFPDAQENLRNFDRDEREEREREHDKILVPLEIYQIEEVHDAGHEGYERHDCKRGGHCAVQEVVVTLVGAEHAVVIGALVYRVHEL